MVVGGHLPVTLEKAIYKYLSALQLHIEVGNWVINCILQLDERVTAVHQFILIAKGVSKYHVDLFKEMDLLLEPGDLTFICDGNPDYVRGGLINVHKRRQVYSKVEEIKRLQRDAYNFQPVPELQNYFTQYPSPLMMSSTPLPTSWNPRWWSTDVPPDPAPPPISAPLHPTSPSSSPTANTCPPPHLGRDDVIKTHIEQKNETKMAAHLATQCFIQDCHSLNPLIIS
eukprot:Em0003g515a